jgi:hypothetical protein
MTGAGAPLRAHAASVASTSAIKPSRKTRVMTSRDKGVIRPLSNVTRDLKLFLNLRCARYLSCDNARIRRGARKRNKPSGGRGQVAAGRPGEEPRSPSHRCPEGPSQQPTDGACPDPRPSTHFLGLGLARRKGNSLELFVPHFSAPILGNLERTVGSDHFLV